MEGTYSFSEAGIIYGLQLLQRAFACIVQHPTIRSSPAKAEMLLAAPLDLRFEEASNSLARTENSVSTMWRRCSPKPTKQGYLRDPGVAAVGNIELASVGTIQTRCMIAIQHTLIPQLMILEIAQNSSRSQNPR